MRIIYLADPFNAQEALALQRDLAIEAINRGTSYPTDLEMGIDLSEAPELYLLFAPGLITEDFQRIGAVWDDSDAPTQIKSIMDQQENPIAKFATSGIHIYRKEIERFKDMLDDLITRLESGI